MEKLRVVVIGKTGVGKRALGNILLGSKEFKSTGATIQCEAQTGMLPSGRQITVVTTPSIMDTGGCDELAKAIAALSPGPHAFLIVLQPGRHTEEEEQTIKQLKGFFGDEAFLEHTLIVMTRKADITDENDDPIDIQCYINNMASTKVKHLYEECGRRIVAVENKNISQDEKNKYATEVSDAVLTMGGYYSHSYFKLLHETKIQTEEVSKLRRQIERVAEKQGRSFCSIS